MQQQTINELVTEEDGRLTVSSPQDCGPLIMYQYSRLFLEQLLLHRGLGGLRNPNLYYSGPPCLPLHTESPILSALKVSWLAWAEYYDEVTCGGVQMIELVHTYWALVICSDGWIFSVHSVANNVSPDSASDSESEPGFPSSPQPSTFSEAAEASPETRVVPALHNFSQLMGITSFSHKLDSLHQAFTIILSNTENCNHLSVAGRMILGTLATLNATNQTDFQQAYDQLLAVAQDPSSHEGIQLVLAEQRAAEHLHILKKRMILLLQDIFSMEESVYAVVPGSLATAVWNFVLYHIKQLMDGLEAI
ncbi:hypothetical protein AOLI_G00311080 [Acnodon oligacanthus]